MSTKKKHNAWGMFGDISVYAEIIDLNKFMKASCDSNIFVSNDDGNQFTIKKGEVEWKEIE